MTALEGQVATLTAERDAARAAQTNGTPAPAPTHTPTAGPRTGSTTTAIAIHFAAIPGLKERAEIEVLETQLRGSGKAFPGEPGLRAFGETEDAYVARLGAHVTKLKSIADNPQSAADREVIEGDRLSAAAARLLRR
jgi:hypothetical protein